MTTMRSLIKSKGGKTSVLPNSCMHRTKLYSPALLRVRTLYLFLVQTLFIMYDVTINMGCGLGLEAVFVHKILRCLLCHLTYHDLIFPLVVDQWFFHHQLIKHIYINEGLYLRLVCTKKYHNKNIMAQSNQILEGHTY